MPAETVSSATDALGAIAGTPGDVEALVRLSTLVWLTPRRRLELALGFGGAASTVAAILDGRAGTEGDRRTLAGTDASAVRSRAASVGATIVVVGRDGYPEQLAALPDAPLALFVIGTPPPPVERCVAIVGARGCSEAGAEIARALARALVEVGVSVVSGAARGIDAAAHLGALDAGGHTIAVLGAGIDRRQPNRALLERIAAEGTVVSEFPPGTPPHPRHFPSRNRIVAGLCRATIVVEGGARSGALITAEHAMEFGRDVFAVPGPVTSPLSLAPLRLIRDGAGAIGGVDDLLADLGLDVAPVAAPTVDLGVDERRALRELRGATLPERVATALGVTVVEALSVLMRLELRGLVRSVGGRFEATLRGAAARDASE